MYPALRTLSAVTVKLKNEKRIVLLVIITLVVVAGLTVLSYSSFKRLIQTAQLLSHATRVINKAEQVVKAVIDFESGQRGFIITGDEAFLEPFYESTISSVGYLNSLDSLTANDSTQRQRVKELRRLINQRYDFSTQVIDMRRESFEKARDLTAAGKGNLLTTEIRSLIKDIQEEERTFFRTNNTISGNSLQQFQYFFVGLAVAIMVIITLLFYSVSATLKARNKIEHKLQKTANEIQDLYDQAPCGYLSVDQRIIISNINQTLLDWLGYTHEEVIGKLKYEDLLSPESRKMFLDSFERDFQSFKEKGYVNDLEFDFQRKDGSVFPVLVNSMARFDEQGNFVNSRTTVFDNSARRQTEEILREREERFRSIVTYIHDAIIIMNEDGCVLNWNKGAENMFGWTEAEMLHQPLTLIMPKKYRAMHTAGLNRFRQTKKSTLIGKSIELEGLRKDNTVFPLDLSIGHWQAGEHILFCGILRDITERKKTEKLMSEMASIVESSEDGIVSLTARGDIFSWNKGAEKLYGYTFEEVRGKPASMLVPVELQPKEALLIDQVTHEHMVKHYETERIRKDGARVNVSLSISPLKDKTGKLVGISKIAHDITSRIRKEQKIQQLNKELDAFTYSVSHDLRAPLRSIAGYSQILQEDYSDKLDDEGKRITQVIIRSAKRMGQLIDDLLNFARMNRMELTLSRINMKQLVEHVLTEFPEINGKLEVNMGALSPAHADNNMLTQVWINLISNAIKYSGKNERIQIEIGSYSEDRQVCYYVRDNGVGFDMQYIDKLFGVFQRLHKMNEFEGTGVGLALVKRIIQRHRGRVWAHGEVNKGATFYFSLPDTIITNPKEEEY